MTAPKGSMYKDKSRGPRAITYSGVIGWLIMDMNKVKRVRKIRPKTSWIL